MQEQTEKEKNDERAATVQLLIRCVVTDEKGKVLYDSREMQSKSFVIQFLEFIGALFDAVDTNATDINNAENLIYQAAQTGSVQMRIDGGIGADTRGIVVGSGSLAATNTDYKLQTRLTHGVGAGQITYDEMTLQAVAVVGANVDLVTYRSFTNNTGEDRTVNEVGVYAIRNLPAYPAYCIIRDVLVAPVTVPDKCSLTVYYTFRTTV